MLPLVATLLAFGHFDFFVHAPTLSAKTSWPAKPSPSRERWHQRYERLLKSGRIGRSSNMTKAQTGTEARKVTAFAVGMGHLGLPRNPDQIGRVPHSV